MAREQRDRSLGSMLRAARAERGLTLRAVERRTGIHNAHLSQIETDTIGKPEIALLWELATLYELDFGGLLAVAGHSAPGDSERLTVAMRTLTELSPADQQEALGFLAGLKARRSGNGAPG